MRKFAIGLLTLAMYAASLPVVVMITPALAATKKHLRPHVSEPWYAARAQQFVPPYTGPVCPGNARGIDCRVYPPPIEDDPDRRKGT